MMLLTYIFYYILSTLTTLIGIYFCRFSRDDYQYNPSLRKKYRYIIIWTYFIMFPMQANVAGAKEMFIYSVNNPVIPFIALLFLISYIIFLGLMKSP
ncbi:hypothetical protein PT276_00715 [Orbaceae bacterium ESL0721]|nr:hypothetical protein [Orbaceae bacterium ESL0721]